MVHEVDIKRIVRGPADLEERKVLLDYMARRPYAEVYQLIAM